MYFDKNGKEIKVEEWGELFTEEYKRIGKTVLANGKVVSTVWLGIDHNFSGTGAPLLFETMVFPSETEFSEEDMQRYATIEEARIGHEIMVNKYKYLDTDQGTESETTVRFMAKVGALKRDYLKKMIKEVSFKHGLTCDLDETKGIFDSLFLVELKGEDEKVRAAVEVLKKLEKEHNQ